MSKLIDYAGLTEFYRKFKEQINAPLFVNLICRQTTGTELDNQHFKELNHAAFDEFVPKWRTRYGGGYSDNIYFLGLVSNGKTNLGPMLFCRENKTPYYTAISNINADDAFRSSKTGLFLYFFNYQDGQLNVEEITDSSKQDKLTYGTNIKTINNQSLLGSGNIEISAPSITVDTSMSDTSTNPVQNKVIKAYIDGLVGNVAAQLAQI